MVTGSQTGYLGTISATLFALSAKIADAVRIRHDLIANFERAAIKLDPASKNQPLIYYLR